MPKRCFLATSCAEHIGKIIESKGETVYYLGKNKDQKRSYPDGETYSSIPDIEKIAGKQVTIIHSGQPDPDRGLTELYFALDILNNPLASRHIEGKKYEYTRLEKPLSIDIFFLYFPYGMQDKVFMTGESIAAESIIRKFTTYYDVSKIYILDAHFEGAPWCDKYPISFVKARPAIIEAMKKDGIKPNEAVAVAPDLGSQSRLEIGGFSKKRLNSYDIELTGEDTLKEKVTGKTVIVWDDLIETGSTMSKVAEKIKNMGAKKVLAAATHGVMPAGVEKIRRSYQKLYLTNSIDNPHANIDISEIIIGSVS